MATHRFLIALTLVVLAGACTSFFSVINAINEHHRPASSLNLRIESSPSGARVETNLPRRCWTQFMGSAPDDDSHACRRGGAVTRAGNTCAATPCAISDIGEEGEFQVTISKPGYLTEV